MTVETAGGFPATGRAHGAAGRAAVVAEGELLWTPGPRRVAEANVTRFADWLSRERGLRFDGYDELWNWSVTDLEGFWGALWDYFGIRSTAPYSSVLDGRNMPGARWFPGARLNYAEHVLRNERSGTDAVVFGSESAAPVGLPWEDFAGRVRVLATRLRAFGVRPGDRVCGYLPNVPQAAIAMLATTAIGAVWASASPDFGSRGVIDRFGQLRPKVLFCVDGYRYGGKTFVGSSYCSSVPPVVRARYSRPNRSAEASLVCCAYPARKAAAMPGWKYACRGDRKSTTRRKAVSSGKSVTRVAPRRLVNSRWGRSGWSARMRSSHRWTPSAV
ncbi:acetyl-coenzyme A synthetase N-terminal domain-containing protein [Streptomyces sp. UG1]|uniref:acetyl-coenzyme A synthetase N-terminal domain-containing protein n=1 Tax=Streptomyces sp. UG1 TaxID=3417652 RepID=UPI003CEE9637